MDVLVNPLFLVRIARNLQDGSLHARRDAESSGTALILGMCLFDICLIEISEESRTLPLAGSKDLRQCRTSFH